MEGGFAFFYKLGTFDFSRSAYTNRGTYPFKLERWRSRLTLDLKAHTGVIAEFNKDEYRDATFPAAAFNANRYGLYLRWKP